MSNLINQKTSNGAKQKPFEIQNMYLFFTILLIGLTSYLMPYIMDYYCLRSYERLTTFYNFHIVNNVSYLIISSTIILALILLLYAIIKRCDVAIGISVLVMSILSYASRLKFVARGELLNYQDLAVTEAANIARSYIKYDNSHYFYVLLGFDLVVIALAIALEVICHKHNKQQTKKKHIIVRCSALLAAIICMILFPLQMKKVSSIQNLSFNKSADSCVLYGFVKSETISFDHQNSSKAYADLKNHAISNDSTAYKTPNVIVIMNESWWNVAPLTETELTFSTDPLEPWKALTEECAYGAVAVNVFAGGTISSETEFLTGANVAYLSSNVGIANILKNRSSNPSIVSYFNDLGYECTAIHPYKADFYSRDAIYQSYGFQRTVFDQDMQFTEPYDAYISDDSLAKQIMYEYEQKGDSPAFVWAVSIAAHSAGLDEETQLNENYAYPIKVDYSNVSLSEEERLEVTRSINSFYLACEAYQSLIRYFENVEEPTVIVMYGDHCPSLSMVFDDLLGINMVNDPYEDRYMLYTTPVLMWKNYNSDNPSEFFQNDASFSGENIQYLIPTLLSYADLPDCEMASILRYYNSEIKTNSVMFMQNNDGTELTSLTKEQEDAFLNFGIFQNDYLIHGTEYNNLWKPQI